MKQNGTGKVDARPAAGAVKQLSFSDPEELVESIPEVDGEFTQLSAGPFAGEILRVGLEDVTLQRTYTGPETSSAQVLDPSVLALVSPIHWEGELIGFGEAIKRSDLLIPSGELVRRSRELTGVWIALDRSRIEATVAALLGVDEATLPAGWVHYPNLWAPLRGAMMEIVEAAARDPERFELPSVCDEANHRLVEGAVSLLVELCQRDQPTEPPPTGKARIVCRAEEFFDGAGEGRVSLADLARYAGVSARSLNYAFQSVYGMSPMQHFKKKRLGRARSRLYRAAPGRGVVKRVAFETGLSELGRFAAEYKALFGELPSVTLGRSWRRENQTRQAFQNCPVETTKDLKGPHRGEAEEDMASPAVVRPE